MKVLEISSEDLEFNIETIKKRAGNTKIIAVIKGNGYGLGLKEFAEFLLQHGISDLAVSSVEEAVELKKLNLDATVLCLESTAIREEIEELLDNDVTITIGNLESAKTLNELAKEKNKKAHVHLKIDTGFSRYGILYSNKEEILNTIKECTSLFVDGVYSHFSYAYSKKDDFMNLQFSRFMSVKNFLEANDISIPIYHIANSSAFLKNEEMFMDAVRIGSAFLGRISVENTIGLKRIGILKSRVVEIKKLEKGTTIGYGNSYKLKKSSNIAIIPLGYADGLNVGNRNDTFKFIDKLRLLKNSLVYFLKDDRIYVQIKDKKYPVVGKIGMNHIAVNIGNDDIKIGEEIKIDVSPIFVSSKIRREYI